MKKTIVCLALAFMAMFAGCDWIKTAMSDVNAETYAKTAGKAIATIIVSTDKYFTAESKVEFAGTLSDVIAQLPTNIGSSNLQEFVSNVVDTKLADTVKDDAKRIAYSAALKVVYQVIGSALQLIESKYTEEFKDASTAYALVKSFLSSVSEAMNSKVVASDNSEEWKAIYDDMTKVVEASSKK